MTIFNVEKCLGLLALGLKFEVVFGIGFFINFHATLDLAITDSRLLTLLK
jgi:hypothetical protein